MEAVKCREREADVQFAVQFRVAAAKSSTEHRNQHALPMVRWRDITAGKELTAGYDIKCLIE